MGWGWWGAWELSAIETSRRSMRNNASIIWLADKCCECKVLHSRFRWSVYPAISFVPVPALRQEEQFTLEMLFVLANGGGGDEEMY